MAFLIPSYNYYGVFIFLKKNNVIKVYVIKGFFFPSFSFFFSFSLSVIEKNKTEPGRRNVDRLQVGSS